MTDESRAIIDAKRDAGPDAYLWVHDSGEVILWSTEEDSENDDGSNAVDRWNVDAATVEELIESGECDEVA